MGEPLSSAGVAAALDAIDAATGRVVDAVAAASPEAMRSPSILPTWSRGHVATHIARNADSLCNLLDSAATGESKPQYPSMDERTAGIEAGAGRGPEDLAHDLAGTAKSFRAAAEQLTPTMWDAPVTLLSGRTVPARWMLPGRMREVEFHHVDLDLGFTPAHWDPGFVGACLDELVTSMGGRADFPELTLQDTEGRERVVRGLGSPVTVTGPAAAILAWIAGRSTGDGLSASSGALPTLPSWP